MNGFKQKYLKKGSQPYFIAEIGINHQGRSKSVEEMRDIPFDLVVTVCDAAAEECPLWLGTGSRVHLGFPDPAKTPGGEPERLAAFRRIRNEMIQKIPGILAGHDSLREPSAP